MPIRIHVCLVRDVCVVTQNVANVKPTSPLSNSPESQSSTSNYPVDHVQLLTAFQIHRECQAEKNHLQVSFLIMNDDGAGTWVKNNALYFFCKVPPTVQHFVLSVTLIFAFIITIIINKLIIIIKMKIHAVF